MHGGNAQAIKYHGTKFGWYTRENSEPNQMVNDHPVYTLENAKDVYSIVYGPRRGWKVRFIKKMSSIYYFYAYKGINGTILEK